MSQKVFSNCIFSWSLWPSEQQNLLWWNKYSKCKYRQYIKRTANAAIYGQIATVTASIAVSHSCPWHRITPWTFTEALSQALLEEGRQDAVLWLQPGKFLHGKAGAACYWQLYSHTGASPTDPKIKDNKVLVILRNRICPNLTRALFMNKLAFDLKAVVLLQWSAFFLHLLKIKSNGKSSWSFTRTGFMKPREQLNLIGLGYSSVR